MIGPHKLGIHLGSEKCYAKRRVKGGIAVYFEWFDNETNRLGEGEPTMFLARASKLALSGNRGCAAIPIERAWRYADSKTGGPTQHLILFAAAAANEIGMEPSRMNIKAIADAIVDNLPDLLRMPPAPDADKWASSKAAPLGEATIFAGGEKIIETEILQ